MLKFDLIPGHVFFCYGNSGEFMFTDLEYVQRVGLVYMYMFVDSEV
jgi:hypothetical protein